MIVLDAVQPDLIWSVWPHMVELFRRACVRVPSQYTPELILQRALSGQSHLWAIYDKDKPLPLMAAGSTAVRGTVVIIEVLGGGNLKEWFHPALAQFEAMAKAKGFTEVEISGRFGWQRLLPDYKPVRISVRKTI